LAVRQYGPGSDRLRTIAAIEPSRLTATPQQGSPVASRHRPRGRRRTWRTHRA
jgi:hypothetical protein